MTKKGTTLALPRRMRLAHARQFAAVRKNGSRQNAGPLTILVVPNELEFSRIGLAISRRVGGAVVRARLKRMLRESFRLLQHDLPRGYDLLISARAHEPLTLEQYQQALAKAIGAAHQTWTSRLKKSRSTGAKPQTDR